MHLYSFNWLRILEFLAPLLELGIPKGDVEAAVHIFMDAQAVSTPLPRSPTSSPIVTLATTTPVSEPQQEPTLLFPKHIIKKALSTSRVRKQKLQHRHLWSVLS